MFPEFKNEPKICGEAAKTWVGGYIIVYYLQRSSLRSFFAPCVHVSTCEKHRLLVSVRFQDRDEVYASPAVASPCYLSLAATIASSRIGG